jgi:hypothetical protein
LPQRAHTTRRESARALVADSIAAIMAGRAPTVQYANDMGVGLQSHDRPGDPRGVPPRQYS